MRNHNYSQHRGWISKDIMLRERSQVQKRAQWISFTSGWTTGKSELCCLLEVRLLAALGRELVTGKGKWGNFQGSTRNVLCPDTSGFSLWKCFELDTWRTWNPFHMYAVYFSVCMLHITHKKNFFHVVRKVQWIPQNYWSSWLCIPQPSLVSQLMPLSCTAAGPAGWPLPHFQLLQWGEVVSARNCF